MNESSDETSPTPEQDYSTPTMASNNRLKAWSSGMGLFIQSGLMGGAIASYSEGNKGLAAGLGGLSVLELVKNTLSTIAYYSDKK